MDGVIARSAVVVEQHICNDIGVLPELPAQDAKLLSITLISVYNFKLD